MNNVVEVSLSLSLTLCPENAHPGDWLEMTKIPNATSILVMKMVFKILSDQEGSEPPE